MLHSLSNRFTTELSETDILSYPWQGLASTNNYTFIPGTINFINSMFSSFIHASSSYGFDSFLSIIYLRGSSSYAIVSTERHLKIFLQQWVIQDNHYLN